MKIMEKTDIELVKKVFWDYNLESREIVEKITDLNK